MWTEVGEVSSASAEEESHSSPSELHSELCSVCVCNVLNGFTVTCIMSFTCVFDGCCSLLLSCVACFAAFYEVLCVFCGVCFVLACG